MRRWRGRSIAELAGRVRQRWDILLEQTGSAPRGVGPRAPAPPRLPFPALTREELVAIYEARPAERAALLHHADQLCADRFPLLGFSGLDFGSPPDWQRDPVRNRRAPDGHWSRIPYLDESLVGDHKIIWELNRHQWLVTLAQAWRLTGDARYPRRIATGLADWLDANPPRRGINWASSLELAFRAIAWTWTLFLAEDAVEEVPGLRRRIMASLELHGIQIERFLSTWFSPNTHLTGEALGLLYLGVAWPGLTQAARWRSTGWDILLDQLPRQVRDDGTYFEQTTWYQAYTADFYLHALLLARNAGLSVPAWAPERIGRAVEVVRALQRTDGTLPLIGDDDGGRLLPLDPDRGHFGDTVALGAAVLGRPESCLVTPVPAATAWVIGSTAWEALAERPVGKAGAGGGAFREGGWYVLRGSQGALVIDAGPHGALAGGHSHADALSVDLTLGSVPVLVDPGTGSYVGPWRNRFRATASHNTLCLSGGIGSATPAGPFRWDDWPRTRVRHWSTDQRGAAFEAEHDGFAAEHAGLRHRRTVLFREGWGWLILDRLIGPARDAELRFQLAPGLVTRVEGPDVSIAGTGGTALLWIRSDGAGTCALEAGLVSPAYGVTRESEAVLRRLSASEAAGGVATLLAPDAAASLRREPGTGPAWTWSGPGGTVRVWIDAEDVSRLESAGLTLTLT